MTGTETPPAVQTPTGYQHVVNDCYDESSYHEINWYFQNGFQVFPLQPFKAGDKNSKVPQADAAWRESTYRVQDVTQAIGWLKTGHSLAWALPSNILVVDVDAPSPGDRDWET